MDEPLRVLLVEDDDTIREIVRETLTDEGFAVREAAHGAEALEILGGWRPNLIILDLMMPVMDGWTFRAHQHARGIATQVPLLVLSASRRAAETRAALGAAAVVIKPFDLNDLIITVRRVLAAPGGGAGNRLRFVGE